MRTILLVRVPLAMFAATGLLLSAQVRAEGLANLDKTLQDGDEQSRLTFTAEAFGYAAATADLDGGGRARVDRTGLNFDGSYRVNDRWKVGLRIANEYSFYDFSSPAALGGGGPFNTLAMDSFTPNATWSPAKGWSVDFGAGVTYARENNADFGDSLRGGGFVTVRHKVAKNLTLGFGVEAQDRFMDNTRVIPMPAIDWRVDDRLHIFTNFEGMHVEEKIADGWFVTFKAHFEPREYRLDDSPSALLPGGVARDEDVRVGLELSWRPNKLVEASVEVGGIVYQKFELLDAVGNERFDANTHPTPYVGGSLALHF